MISLLRFSNPRRSRVCPRRSLRGLFAGAALALLLVLTSVSAYAQERYPQRTERFINDYAGLLNAEDRAALQTLCADLDRNRGVELVVVMIDSIDDYDTPDQTIESFATNLFNTWGIGDAQRNDGVLLLVAVKDRKVRIEVGSGYGDRYNATMQQVIDRDILPSFRGENYSQGINNGAQAIVATLAAPPPSASNPPQGDVSVDDDPPVSSVPSTLVPKSAPSAPISPVAIIGGGVAALGAAGFGARRYMRNRPRSCPHCQARMARLDEFSDDMYLDSGQKLEERLNSVDYDVWRCPQCNMHTIEPYRSWFSSWGACPGCHYRTLRSHSRTLESPTYSSTGRKEVTRDCQQCNYHDRDIVILPRLTRSSSSRSSGSSSGGSFGGGRSSGGGASGSW